MVKSYQIHDAIEQIERNRVGRRDMAIFAPLGTIEGLLYSETAVPAMEHLLVESGCEKRTKYAGVLVIEDPMCTEVIVRSLISNHRVVIEEKP